MLSNRNKRNYQMKLFSKITRTANLKHLPLTFRHCCNQAKLSETKVDFIGFKKSIRTAMPKMRVRKSPLMVGLSQSTMMAKYLKESIMILNHPGTDISCSPMETHLLGILNRESKAELELIIGLLLVRCTQAIG